MILSWIDGFRSVKAGRRTAGLPDEWLDDALRYAAARLWVDAIIDPAETREVIARSLAAAAMNPRVAEFRTGVLQT